jgi:hypothetical protein
MRGFQGASGREEFCSACASCQGFCLVISDLGRRYRTSRISSRILPRLWETYALMIDMAIRGFKHRVVALGETRGTVSDLGFIVM